MTLPRYREYKDSGIGWLGDVPRHWDVKRLRRVGEAFIGLTYNPDDVVDEGVGVLVLRSSNVQKGVITFDDNVYVNMDIPASLRTRVGDILLCSRNGSRALIGKNAAIDEQSEGVTFGAFMTVFRSEANAFLRYVFNSALFSYQSGAFLTSTINQLTVGSLYSFEVPLPPPPEQTAIATFLDRETGKIDALVAEQEKLIALLKEKRQAVISHAVTKGLDPAAPMKDTGIEWLGEVPAHWDVVPVKRVLEQMASGTSVNSIDVPAADGEYGVLKTSCVYRGVFDPSENKAVVPGEYSRASCPLRAATIIVSRMNTPELVGAAGLVSEATEGLFLPDRLWQVSFSAAYPSFAYYWTQTGAYRGMVQMVCTGTSSSMQNLSQDQFRCFDFPLPPLHEQTAIATFLDCETAKLDALVIETRRAIDLLKERRTALISAAVTGKIDVRDLVDMQEAA